MTTHLLTLLAALSLTAAASAQTIQVNKDNKTIAITSTDSAEREADTAEVSIGFIAYGTDQDGTYADATRTSNQIIAALDAAGVKRQQIQSDAQSLTTVDPEDKVRYTKGIRFVFSQSWKVTTKADSAAEALHVAVTSGANKSGAINWLLADENALEAEAAAKALKHAHEIGDRMASGLHAKLGPLVYASNQLPMERQFDRMVSMASLSSIAKTNLKPLAILPNKVTRTATVYAVFSIE